MFAGMAVSYVANRDTPILQFRRTGAVLKYRSSQNYEELFLTPGVKL